MPPKELTQAEVLEILEALDFARLVGTFENDTLECKASPYDLEPDGHKIELAKDVSALANAAGGVLLIGFVTSKNPTNSGDTITSVIPFPTDRFDPDRYRKILSDWLYPDLPAFDIHLYASASDNTHAVAAIVVPPADAALRPILVAKTILGHRRTEIVFGYCERQQDFVTHHDVRKLHALIRDGLRFEETILPRFDSLEARFDSLEATILEGRKEPLPIPSPRQPEKVEARISAALHAVGLDERPAFTLIAVPPRTLNMAALFERRDSLPVDLLENPPRLRPHGFGIYSGGNSKIVEGRLRRAVGASKLLEFHRDGVAIFACDAERLCWGQEKKDASGFRLNQLALIEMTYLFCLTTWNLYESYLQSGDSVSLELRIERFEKGNRNFSLETGTVAKFSSGDQLEAPPGPCRLNVEAVFNADSPERAAFKLIAALYTWVGFDEDRVPYSTGSPGGRRIDPSLIRSPTL